jgi:MucR family transcriptional regulator, transcriptional regulator of exopolysaccharide biosynthesis
MTHDSAAQKVDPGLVAHIVQSYVAKNTVAVDQLASLIATVHQALSRLGTAPPLAANALAPAVPIRRSVQQDHVVCLECGFRAQILRRHLRVQHGLEVAAYRARWKLSPDHPVTAPSYSERRSTMAKELGLGRQPVPAPEPPPPPQPTPRTRRSRRPTAS